MSGHESGDPIWVNVVKGDGRPHRRWPACVESSNGNLVVVVAPVGTIVSTRTGSSAGRYHIRAHFWLGRHYTLSEFYHPDGNLALLYSDICSPVTLRGNDIYYIDRELDVAHWTGKQAEIVDEDEFAEAIAYYGYSAEFQQQCYQAAAEALALVRAWKPIGLTPSFSLCP